MMPGVGFEEMILLVVAAVVVIGPKDLPLMMRKFGRFTGKMRAMAFEFKQGFDELGRQAELEELRREVANLKAHTGLDDLRKDLEQERHALHEDMAAATAALPAPPATHPAAASAVAPFAGLSAEHPGYDTGEAAPAADVAVTGMSTGAQVEVIPPGATLTGAISPEAMPPEAGAPHIIPDDEIAPQAPAIKQDVRA